MRWYNINTLFVININLIPRRGWSASTDDDRDLPQAEVLYPATSIKTGGCSEQSEIDLSVKTKIQGFVDRVVAFFHVEPQFNFAVA